MLTQEEDQQLVERVQRGDRRAFDLLVLKYQHKILGLIVRFVHDTHEAQDVAQEAFIKAYRALGNFRGDSAFYTWLYRIAINTAKKLSGVPRSAATGQRCKFRGCGILRRRSWPQGSGVPRARVVAR